MSLPRGKSALSKRRSLISNEVVAFLSRGRHRFSNALLGQPVQRVFAGGARAHSPTLNFNVQSLLKLVTCTKEHGRRARHTSMLKKSEKFRNTVLPSKVDGHAPESSGKLG